MSGFQFHIHAGIKERWIKANIPTIEEITMGRRSKPVGRSTVLGSDFHRAESRVEKLNLLMAATMVEADFHRGHVVEWLFSTSTIKKLMEAYPLTGRHVTAMVYKHECFYPARVWISFDHTPELEILTPTQEVMCVDEGAAAPLVQVVKALQKIHEDFAVVHHVLHWMDANATLGAMRYYWPSVAALVPGNETLQGACPLSYTEPYRIAEQLPLLRDAATTVAAAAMLDDKKPIKTRGLSILFEHYKFVRHGVDVSSPRRDYEL